MVPSYYLMLVVQMRVVKVCVVIFVSWMWNLIVVYLICTHFISSTPYSSVDLLLLRTNKVAAASNGEEELWDLDRMLSHEEICDPYAQLCDTCREFVGCCIWSCNLWGLSQGSNIP